MISRMRLTSCVSLTCILTFGAPPGSQGDLTHIAAGSPTPVLQIIEDLIAKHRWEIHFEDWGEVKGENLKEIFGTNGQKWLVRQPSTISLDVPSLDKLPKNLRGQVMAQILSSHRAGGPPIVFGSSFNGGALQVFPIAAKQADGTLLAVIPLFETKVTIPLGRYSIGENSGANRGPSREEARRLDCFGNSTALPFLPGFRDSGSDRPASQRCAAGRVSAHQRASVISAGRLHRATLVAAL